MFFIYYAIEFSQEGDYLIYEAYMLFKWAVKPFISNGGYFPFLLEFADMPLGDFSKGCSASSLIQAFRKVPQWCARFETID